MDLLLILEWAIKSVVIILIVLGGFAYLTLYERRALARIQTRIGPNRAGPWGLLQPIADAIKLIFKEELIPEKSDKVLFILAPVITVVPAMILLAVIPMGPDILGISIGLADGVNVGVLYTMPYTAMDATAII